MVLVIAAQAKTAAHTASNRSQQKALFRCQQEHWFDDTPHLIYGDANTWHSGLPRPENSWPPSIPQICKDHVYSQDIVQNWPYGATSTTRKARKCRGAVRYWVNIIVTTVELVSSVRRGLKCSNPLSPPTGCTVLGIHVISLNITKCCASIKSTF